MHFSAASNTMNQFTGKERDVETGLDYFMARYLSSAQGRFTSPDPLLASARLTDPQTWNRYAYVRNDPVNMIDPDGRMVTVINSSVFQFYLSIGWTPEQFYHLFASLPGYDISPTLDYGFTRPDGEGGFSISYGPAIEYANRGAVGGGYGGGAGSSSGFSVAQSQFLTSAVGKISDAMNSNLMCRGCGEFMSIAASALRGFGLVNDSQSTNLLNYDPISQTILINDYFKGFSTAVATGDSSSFAARLAEEYYHAAQTAKKLYGNLGADPRQEYYATSFALQVANWVGASDGTKSLLRGNLDRWGQRANIDRSQRGAARNCEIK